ncbi:MAG: DUF928 domain-containing protein [Oscillatoria sp. SIO1A7]|nr:DUF928 domain-containing protein [Oscillatoria sp. SIO1A7]
MDGNQKLQGIGMFALALVFGMAFGQHARSAMAPGTSSQVRASSKPELLQQNRILAKEFNPPSRGAPPRTTEGGSRGCGSYKKGEKPLIALAPTRSLALTVQKHPTFFWHIPESYGGQTLEFVLLDAKDEQELYRDYFSVPQVPGIASLKLPDTVEPLAEEKMYHWYLVAVCDPEDRTGDITIDGWIERVEPSQDLLENIEQASEKERPSIYGKEGIWQETIATLAKLRLENPNDSSLKERWEKLLTSVKLGEFAQYPLVRVSKTEAQGNQALSRRSQSRKSK